MLRRSRQTVPAWPEVRDRVTVAAAGFDITVSGPGDEPSVRWVDGPAPASLVEAVGDLPGWTWRAEDAPPAPGAVITYHRRLSDRALAVAVVRYYASRGRPWSSAEGAAGQAAWRALVDVDHPDRCAYPIADTIADLLLAAGDPPTVPDGPTAAEVMAAKLTVIGYERLWAVAFAAVP